MRTSYGAKYKSSVCLQGECAHRDIGVHIFGARVKTKAKPSPVRAPKTDDYDIIIIYVYYMHRRPFPFRIFHRRGATFTLNTSLPAAAAAAAEDDDR